MALYFLLGTLTGEGQRMLNACPDLMSHAARECCAEDARILGQYAVIGKQDFLIMAEADDNEAVARLSLNIGMRAGLHIETLPAIAIGYMAKRETPEREGGAQYADNPLSYGKLPDHGPLPPINVVYGRRRN